MFRKPDGTRLKLAILMSSNSPWSREAAIRLAENGHLVHVIDLSVRDSENYINSDANFQTADMQQFTGSVSSIDKIRFSRLQKLGYLRATWELHRILAKRNCNFLLTLYGGGFAAMAYLSGFHPYGVYVVGSDVLFGGRAKRLISRFALTAADVVMVNGQHLVEKTKELAARAKAQCLYLGTDMEKFTPGSPAPRPVKIVCTRGFSEVYNNEYLIRALKEIPDSTEGFQLIFAAPGPLLDNVRTIADQILPTHLRRSIKFRAGVGREHMAELLRSSHIYVSVSRSDGTSLSLMEGLACGLFPVLSDIPANREWISDEAKNGILVPLDEPRTLAAALLRAMGEPEVRAKAAVHNRELMLKRADGRKNMAILGCELQRIALRHAN